MKTYHDQSEREEKRLHYSSGPDEAGEIRFALLIKTGKLSRFRWTRPSDNYDSAIGLGASLHLSNHVVRVNRLLSPGILDSHYTELADLND